MMSMAELDADLKSEYILLQGQYEAFDSRALTIKSWAAPLLAGGLGPGLKEYSIAVELATILAASCLWLLEGIWKNFQYCYIQRIELIERFFRGEASGETIKPFQMFDSWGKEWNRWFRHRRALAQRLRAPFVFLPYLPIIIGCVMAILWIASAPLLA
jgi:hypothetical protein